MLDDIPGMPFAVTQRGALVPQALEPVTQICPVVKLLENVIDTVLVPFGEANVAPEGTLQL